MCEDMADFPPPAPTDKYWGELLCDGLNTPRGQTNRRKGTIGSGCELVAIVRNPTVCQWTLWWENVFQLAGKPLIQAPAHIPGVVVWCLERRWLGRRWFYSRFIER